MNKYLIALVAIGLSLPVVAQTDVTEMKKLKLTGVSTSLGITFDRYNSMNLEQLSQLAKQPELMNRDLDGLTEEASTNTAGISLFANMIFSPVPKPNATYFDNQEFRFGIGLNSAKEAMVSYKSKDLDTSLVFCNVNSEITFEAAYVLKHTFNKRLFFYFGLGTNSSISVNNEMMIITGKYFAEGQHPSTQERANALSFAAKPILYSRIFIPWGLHLQASDRFSIGLDFRKGRGLQYTAGEKMNLMANTGAFMIGTRVLLN